MKVVHLVIDGRIGGGQRIALSLARALQGRGGNALVVSPSPGPLLELATAEGVPATVSPHRGAGDLAGSLRLARLLRRERAALLHTHAMLEGNVVGRLAGRLAGVPVVAHMHTETVFRRNPVVRSVQRAVDNATARLCARVIAVSDHLRAVLEAQGYPADRIVVVPNGVEVPGAEPAPELGLPPGGPVVVLVGRLDEAKGQRDLVRALAVLPRVRAVLVGDGPDPAYRDELEREAERLGVRDRILLTGARSDAGAILAAADALVLPSHREGLPLVVLEAMARGRPVVATRVGGTPEAVVDGETGLLVPPGDPDALAAAIGRVIEDPELARRLGEAGRSRVRKRFSAEAMADCVLALYEEVVPGSRPGGADILA